MVNADSSLIAPPTARITPSLASWALAAATLVALLVAFREPLQAIISAWLNTEEYNYGPLVPVLSAVMIWRDLRRTNRPIRGQWVGIVILVFGLLLGVIEARSQIQFPGQVGLFVSVIGVFVCLQGFERSKAVWPGLILLFFAMPLALAIQVKLTSAMQLVSSRGAVELIRFFGLPVLREGNVIDLGLIQLQVAEACSGLRYLFPLATFAFLCAYLFIARPITRAIVFLSSIPITIGMNIFRIALTAVLVDRYGIEAAEGFFHSFEGWAVYILCLAILALEMKILCYVDGTNRSVIRRLDFDVPPVAKSSAPQRRLTALGAAAALSVAMLALVTFTAEQNTTLERVSFTHFPAQIDTWYGVDAPVDEDSLKLLNATDYLSLNYRGGAAEPVGVWIAYYDAQVSGNSAHSPEVCIPGGGWEIEKTEQIKLAIDGSYGQVLPINRLVIAQGGRRQLVYYWFVEGGQPEANEYDAKVTLFLNALVKQRRDGALVRFITPMEGAEGASDERLQQFIRRFVPQLPPYLPA